MTYVIAQPCVDVKGCARVGECPADCIYEGACSLYIHPEECADCGACEPVRPTEAIFYEDDLPSEWPDYLRADVGFFNGLGSPDDTQRADIQDLGDPMITTLPPQNEEWKAENL